jgi:hypothetical protein
MLEDERVVTNRSCLMAELHKHRVERIVARRGPICNTICRDISVGRLAEYSPLIGPA